MFNDGGNFFQLMPDIQQSTTNAAGSAYNERIGNEICLKELDIHGYLSYDTLANFTANPQNAKLAVRVMILRSKEINDQELLFDNMNTNSLLRFGEPTGGVGGPKPYNGNPLDSFRDINRDAFAVRYDKVFYMNGPQRLVVSDTTDLALNPSSLRIIRHKMTFGKNGLKLKFTGGTDVQANNFPYFMVIGYSSMSDPSVPSQNIVNATFNISSKYTDA